MAELLLELLSEEIPAGMQARAAEDLKRLVTAGMKEAGLEFDKAEAYVTPRRLALRIDAIPEKQPDINNERKGPSVDAPDKAIQGFLKSAGLDSLDQCEKRETPKGAVWFAVIEKEGRDTRNVLPELLSDAIRRLSWPKSMRWADTIFTWVRPLHGILAVFDGEVIRDHFSMGIRSASRTDKSPKEPITIDFGNKTYGHRFLTPKPFEVSSFADYEKKLRKAHVILDPAERRKIIAAGLEKLAKREKLAVRDDPALLDEVVGLVEWPVVLGGRIDDAFMDLPPEVLITAMRSHQKYFALLNSDGRLAPRFALVANMETGDGGKRIAAGNERVLRARLADARFFWDQDRKRTLSSRTTRLADIVFHARLGTLDDKVDRVQALAVEIAKHIPGAGRDRVRAAAHLAKADLVTGMVGEFPELQGVMGRYYALEDGEHEEVAEAIRDHYAPRGPSDACPSAPVSVAVALADKIDTLVGFWAIDEKPTGSKDPFALRRAALGAIRLVIENGLKISLFEVFATANDLYPAEVRASHKKTSSASDPDLGTVSYALLTFITDRLKIHLKGQGVRHDLISAVFTVRRPSGGPEDDLVRLIAKSSALQAFIDSDDGANLLTAYRRAANILRIEEKKDGKTYVQAPDADAFEQAEETALGRALEAASKAVETAVANEKFADAMKALAALRAPVDAFFDKVTVNADDAGLRANRLRLLSRIRTTMGKIADFGQIEG